MAFGSIGRELRRRGHRVTVFQTRELAHKISAEDLDFVPIPDHGFSVQSYIDLVTRQHGACVKNFLDYARKSARMFCEAAIGALLSARVDGVLVDINEPGAATAAEAAGLPFVTVCNALPLHAEAAVPPDFLPWQYRDAMWAGARNRIGYAMRNILISPLQRVVNRYRHRFGLRPYRRPDDSFSPYAQISQLVAEFDLPRKRLPDVFHYVGPYRREPERDIPFPYERLDGKPLIYASLGTGLGCRSDIWNEIIRGCSKLNAQLVLALGHGQNAGALLNLPTNAILVDYAPQRELLSLASLFVTHAGLNSAMEALAASVPTIAIPITGDQFGVAARIVYTQTGQIIFAKQCTGLRIEAAAHQILTDPIYRQRASMIRAAICKTTGAAGAAAIIENAIDTGRPVYRSR